MLYMNESKNKKNESSEQIDLFGYHDLTTSGQEPAPDSFADVEPQRDPEEPDLTPETLPLIREEPPAPEPVVIEQKPRKAPLIFSAHAPIPTRGNGREEDSRRKRILEQTSREIAPLTLEQIPADLSLGKILTLARENAAYTVDAVADITRISSNFILAFENDEFKRLPPFIYQIAYLREMCNLYKLPQETRDFLLQLHRGLQGDEHGLFQDDSMLNKPVDDRRATLIFTGGMIAIGVVIVLAIWAVIIALVKHNGEEEVYQQQIADAPAVQPASTPVEFDQKKLKNLTHEPMLDIRMLEMSKSGKTRD